MSVTMPIIQRFNAPHEREFMALEREFAALEASRPDYPRGRRLQPMAANAPCNSLIWEAEFNDLESARRALDFFAGDAAHEELLERQRPFFEEVRIELYQNLEFA
jgi:antibiotic biosynthesis monooxygenase (ABM) superfamily enzyme